MLIGQLPCRYRLAVPKLLFPLHTIEHHQNSLHCARAKVCTKRAELRPNAPSSAQSSFNSHCSKSTAATTPMEAENNKAPPASSHRATPTGRDRKQAATPPKPCTPPASKRPKASAVAIAASICGSSTEGYQPNATRRQAGDCYEASHLQVPQRHHRSQTMVHSSKSFDHCEVSNNEDSRCRDQKLRNDADDPRKAKDPAFSTCTSLTACK